MANYAIGDKVLDGWEITRLIGEGGYGRVFEVRKGLGSRSSASTNSALKVVSIPPSDSLVESALAEGASHAEVAAEYREIADSFMDEAALLSSLSHPGIVGYQDHQSIPHPDGIGWDILLRMELLEPLTRTMARRPLDAGEAVRLGAELADTLAFCHARGVIHRDVKPENIFADASGRYKLGDFGVSRTVEGTAGTLSRKGTEDYMAPELYYEHRYGASVDVYALGLVLYRLLNGNRLPFLPPVPQTIRYADREAAQRRRLSGEPLPCPAGCDPELFAIVERACAHDPEKRPSAAELRDALWAYGRARSVSPYSDGAAKASGAASAQPAGAASSQAASRPTPRPAEASSRTRGVWDAFGAGAAPPPVSEPSPAPKREDESRRREDTPPSSPKSAEETAHARPEPAASTAEPGPKGATPEPDGPASPIPATPPAARPGAKRPGTGVVVGAGIAALVLVLLIVGISASQGAQQSPSSSIASVESSPVSVADDSSAAAEGGAQSASIGDTLDFPLDLAAIDPDSPADMADLASVLQGFYEWKHGEDECDFFASEEMQDAYLGYGGLDSAPWELTLRDHAEEEGYDSNNPRFLTSEDVASGNYTLSTAEFWFHLPYMSLSYEELAGYVVQVFGYEKVAIWGNGTYVEGRALKGDTMAYISVYDAADHSIPAIFVEIVVHYKEDASRLSTFDYVYGTKYSDDTWAEKYPDIYRASREG